MTKYRFASGYRYSADPQKIGQEIEAAMDKRDGKLETAELVEIASDPASELHKCFTWEDTEAAHKWRLQEARRLIRSVRVVVEEIGEARPIAVNVQTADAQHYSSPQRVINNADEAACALRDAMNRLDASQRSLSELQALLGRDSDRKRVQRGARLVQRARDQVGEVRAAM